MSWIGDEESAAPHLRQARPSPAQAHRWFHLLLDQVRLFLAHDRIHGDLSEYNILIWEEEPTVIDFPQAVDPRFNRNALDLLGRYFGKFGIECEPRRLAGEMWSRWLQSDLLGLEVGAEGQN